MSPKAAAAAIPADAIADTSTLAPYFAASLAYVGGLKPKPTTR